MVQCENLVKIYKASDLEVVALQGLDLTVAEGELMAIIGNSGSGKSTLLNMLGGLDRPSAGRLFIDGKDMLKMNRRSLIKYKKETVGFVWQNNARNLVPYLTAVENVELPMILKGRTSRKRAYELLDLVGMSHRRHNRLSQLSGGEQQRIAIAIALSNNPRMLLADEPTGAVDSKMANQILDVLRALNQELGLTIIIVTHDMQLSRKVDRVVAIRDGRTSSEILRRKSYKDELAEIEAGLAAEEEENSHVEVAVVDRAGRLQIPREYLDGLGYKNQGRMLVEMEDGRIILRVHEEENKPEPESAGAEGKTDGTEPPPDIKDDTKDEKKGKKEKKRAGSGLFGSKNKS